MSFKKELFKVFSNKEKLLDLRYEGVGIIFLISVLAFSLNFFFIGARFHLEFNLMLFSYIYTIFMTIISVGFFFLLKGSFRNIIKGPLNYLVGFICFIVFVILMLPMVLSKEALIDLISKYL